MSCTPDVLSPWAAVVGTRFHGREESSGKSVYVGSAAGSISALRTRPNTGSLLWRFQTEGPVVSSPVVENGRVYLGSFDRSAYALSADAGSLLWQYQTAGHIASSPAVDGDIVYIGSFDHAVYALRANDGALLWRYQTGSIVVTTPGIGPAIASPESQAAPAQARERLMSWLASVGLEQEQHEVQRQVAAAKTAPRTTADRMLSQIEWQRETSLGENERSKGDWRAAAARFKALLARIEAQPAGAPLGRGSYAYCLTLHRLASCLVEAGQLAMAIGQLRTELAGLDALLQKEPGNPGFVHERHNALADLDVLLLRHQAVPVAPA
jgi:hypothetical protein